MNIEDHPGYDVLAPNQWAPLILIGELLCAALPGSGNVVFLGAKGRYVGTLYSTGQRSPAFAESGHTLSAEDQATVLALAQLHR